MTRPTDALVCVQMAATASADPEELEAYPEGYLVVATCEVDEKEGA